MGGSAHARSNMRDLLVKHHSHCYLSPLCCVNARNTKLAIIHDNEPSSCTGGGTAKAQWLRCCTTNRKVAGSIPGGVIGIFHWQNSSDRTMALGWTQPLTEMTTSSISWGWKRPVHKADNLPPSCAVVMKSGNLNFLRTLWAYPGL